ncbi:hypothetical protein FE391_05935 [Nonomuraea sp. KC401]|uniref:hypothetical protein n=1 Tax=unclassified Nonomuraea TaxID=2593643 RepID=UPI0010FE312B|nr:MULTISPECIES: hypothetical protein [unclassified Nonomuraea]NBE92357.1 hypothetical protein [Nonomuraea sp. K271]TLF81842.1 hypothetical protein FE391_05935 [Nonomuraea sp. KC401]
MFYYPFQWLKIQWGHTGWAFKVPGDDRWVMGSADNTDHGGPEYTFNSRPKERNVWVIRVANFDVVKHRFRELTYTSYRCAKTKNSAVGAAQQHAFKERGYDFVSNNCAHHTYNTLRVYGVPTGGPPPSMMTPPKTMTQPGYNVLAWYNSMPTSLFHPAIKL